MHSVMKLHKLSHKLHKKGLHRLAKLVWIVIRIIFASDIPPSVEFGDGVQLFHNGLGCVIHRHARIGEGTYIYQNVTIGGSGNCKNNGVPKIGKNVFIGAGAVLIGDIEIGNNVVIGANTLVNKSIEDNSLVIGRNEVRTYEKA